MSRQRDLQLMARMGKFPPGSGYSSPWYANDDSWKAYSKTNWAKTGYEYGVKKKSEAEEKYLAQRKLDLLHRDPPGGGLRQRILDQRARSAKRAKAEEANRAKGLANGGITAGDSATHAGPAPVSAYMFARLGTQMPVYGLEEGGVAREKKDDPKTSEEEQKETEAQAEMAREDLTQTTEFVPDNRLNMNRTPIENINTLRNFEESGGDGLLPLQLVHSTHQV